MVFLLPSSFSSQPAVSLVQSCPLLTGATQPLRTIVNLLGRPPSYRQTDMKQTLRFTCHLVLLRAAFAYTSSVDPNCPSRLTTSLSWDQYITCAASMLDCYFPAGSCFSDSDPFTANLTCLCANTAFITEVAINVYYWCQCDHPGILELTAATFVKNCSDSFAPPAYNKSQIIAISSQTTLTCTTSTSSTSPATSATDTPSTSTANPTLTATPTAGSVININGSCFNFNNQGGQNTAQGEQNITCTSPEPSDRSSGGTKLAPGAIAGIVIGAFVGLVGLPIAVFQAWIAWKKHEREREEESAKSVGTSQDNRSSESADAIPLGPTTRQP